MNEPGAPPTRHRRLFLTFFFAQCFERFTLPMLLVADSAYKRLNVFVLWFFVFSLSLLHAANDDTKAVLAFFSYPVSL